MRRWDDKRGYLGYVWHCLLAFIHTLKDNNDNYHSRVVHYSRGDSCPVPLAARAQHPSGHHHPRLQQLSNPFSRLSPESPSRSTRAMIRRCSHSKSSIRTTTTSTFFSTIAPTTIGYCWTRTLFITFFCIFPWSGCRHPHFRHQSTQGAARSHPLVIGVLRV